MKENLGSLLFETPEKGKSNRNGFLLGSENFFFERIDQSPSPFKIEENEAMEPSQHENFLSPSRFLINSNCKYF